MAGKPAELRLGAQCALQCAPCDCRYSASTPAQVERTLKEGGPRLVLRGAPTGEDELGALLARATGFAELIVRSACHEFAAVPRATALARAGAHGVILPAFSHVPEVHDRIAGRKDALVHSLLGVRALVAAGLSAELEVPILSARLQNPEALVELWHRAVPTLRAIRFFAPRHELPAAIAPSPWPQASAGLAAALRRCRTLGIEARLRPSDALPICALQGHADVQDAFRFDPRHEVKRLSGCELLAPCEACAVKRVCVGVATSYSAAHGAKGLSPFSAPIRGIDDQRTTPRRQWTAEQKKAAGRAEVLVIRPTVNCNQDCTFCSANETSQNVWTDPDEMVRAIARAARRGVTHLSFSGGEPTLSRELPRFLRAAKRVGIPKLELVTNAVLLDSERRVKELVDAGLSHAFVSLHTHDEAISATLTQKRGDHARTVRGIQRLLDAGVHTVLNHVITSRNAPFVERYIEFIHREFGGRAKLSFAFVTPQFKALENLDLIPKLTEVMPYLRRAMRLATELGQHFIVGSRQGIPPCFLREFEAWSDVLDLANEALSEDAPQKERAPGCDDCRYSNQCTGLWKVYTARYGTAELRPLAGRKMDDGDLQALKAARQDARGYVTRFQDAPESFRDLAAEAEPLSPLPSQRPASLPIFQPVRSRPLRLGLIGTGHQARRLARTLEEVAGLTVDFVASPHASHADLRAFGNCPAFEDPAQAMDEIRPEAVIIAAATPAHAALARAAHLRGIPALVEKPLAHSEAEAALLVELTQRGGSLIMPAHAVLHAPGLAELWSAGPHRAATLVRRLTPESPEALPAWSASALSELLYHLFVLTGHTCGGGAGAVSEVLFSGDSVPERLRLSVRYPGGEAELRLEFGAAADELLLTARDSAGNSRVWQRSGREVLAGPAGATRPIHGAGSDTAHLLASFRDVVLGHAEPLARAEDALDVMRTVADALRTAAAAGVPLRRSGAPIHVASRAL